MVVIDFIVDVKKKNSLFLWYISHFDFICAGRSAPRPRPAAARSPAPQPGTNLCLRNCLFCS